MAANSSSLYINYFYHCSNSASGKIISTAFIIATVFLLLPLSFFVLYLHHQQQQHSFATTSHSDIFTYHSVAMNLIFVLGATFYFCAEHFGLNMLMMVGFYITCNYFSGQISFHVLTCLDRYLAVVHPVIYLGLRQSGGVRIRNISIGCVWLLYCGWIGVTALYFPNFPYIPYFCSLVLALVIVSFCSLSILCVLIRPRPGEHGGNRERNDQSKQRAFHTIMVITGVLWLFFLGFLSCIALENSHVLSSSEGCLVLMSAKWLGLPSSLILPLLFLQRAQKVLTN